MRAVAAIAVTAVAAAGALAPGTPVFAAPGPPPPPGPWLVEDGLTKLVTVIKGAGADRADRDDPDDGNAVSGVALTGAGIGVALIDSGVSPVKGLSGPGKVINGPDLSFESQAPNLRFLDTFGHGTHMAGVIAGQDPAGSTGTRFSGVAPGARIISVKVASAGGRSWSAAGWTGEPWQ